MNEMILNTAEREIDRLEKGGVFYLPKDTSAKSFPTTASEASFGIDFGKIFSAGYFTSIINRSSDNESVKIYYKRYEIVRSYDKKNGYVVTETESEPNEITTSIAEFTATIAKDAGRSFDSSENSENYSYTDKEVWYKIGIMANRDIITQALPGIASMETSNTTIDKARFIKIFTISQAR